MELFQKCCKSVLSKNKQKTNHKTLLLICPGCRAKMADCHGHALLAKCINKSTILHLLDVRLLAEVIIHQWWHTVYIIYTVLYGYMGGKKEIEINIGHHILKHYFILYIELEFTDGIYIMHQTEVKINLVIFVPHQKHHFLPSEPEVQIMHRKK